MIDPWKSALTSFGCIPEDFGMSFAATDVGTGWDGLGCSPSNSDMYPIHI